MNKLHRKEKIFENNCNSNRFILICAIFFICSFLFFLFYSPLLKLFQFSFIDESTLTFSQIIEIFTSSINISSLIFSFFQAFLSSFLCLIIGFPVGYILAKYDFKGKKIILSILTVPFVLPPIVILLGFIIVFGPEGWINSFWMNSLGFNSPLISIFGSIEGIIIAHVFYNVSVIIRMTIPAWQNIDHEMINVAKTMGASRKEIFFVIILPQIKNSLISALLLVFTYCFNSFAIILYLGEVKYQTLEVRIYKLMTGSLDFSAGASIAIIQLIINVIIIAFYLNFEQKTRKMAIGKEKSFSIEKIKIIKSKIFLKNNFFILLIILFLSIILIFTLLPLIAVIITSFIPYSDNISIFWGYSQIFGENYHPLLDDSPIKILINTLVFAGLATLLTLFLSICFVYIVRNKIVNSTKEKKKTNKLVNLLIILPMATSSITLAFGLFLQFQNSILYPDYVWVIVIAAHVLISVPFTTRSIISSYNRIDIEMLHVATTLGASRFQIFRKIELPLVKKGIIVGCIFAFAISIGEFGATKMLVRSDYNTLSVGISKLLYSRTLQLPAAMATILILFTFISFYLIHKLGDIRL